MSTNDTSATAEVWLALLKEGGRCSAAEVNRIVKSADAAWVLSELAKTGSARKYEKSPTSDRVRYGVTASCKIPRGVTIGDILACNLYAEEA